MVFATLFLLSDKSSNGGYSNKKQKGGLWKVQKGVLLSTCSVLYLVKKLFDLGYRYVLTARFTNDCIGKERCLKMI